jgi:hypothetical protein
MHQQLDLDPTTGVPLDHTDEPSAFEGMEGSMDGGTITAERRGDRALVDGHDRASSAAGFLPDREPDMHCLAR